MMVSSTLTQYKDSYKLNLEQFLNDYEDNTALFFLQKEKETYQNYQNALTKISDQIKMFTRDELKRNLVHINIAADLKKINTTAYNTIITEQSKLSPPEVVLSLHFEKSNTININEVELANHIRSSIVILKFIGELITNFGITSTVNNLQPIIRIDETIINIIKYPSYVLSEVDHGDFLGNDEHGISKYREVINPLIYNYEADIYRPFATLQNLTIELMESTQYSKFSDRYLKMIFKEFINIFSIVSDYDDELFSGDYRAKTNYPKNREAYVCTYKIELSEYYKFITQFIDSEFIRLEEDSIKIEQSKKEIKSSFYVDKQKDNSDETNDLLKSTIDDYLEIFKEDIKANGYDVLVNSLIHYFTNGTFPELTEKINFKKINKKRLGWALKELYKSEKTNAIEIAYFRFAKESINLFANEIIAEENFNKSNFYKLFTTNLDK